jgi:hypothetical protein
MLLLDATNVKAHTIQMEIYRQCPFYLRAAQRNCPPTALQVSGQQRTTVMKMLSVK